MWTPQTDQFPSLSISTITLSPTDRDGNPLTAATDPDNTVLFAGTGSFSNSGRTRDSAKGLMFSDDGGQTWNAIGVDFFNDLRITSIVPTGGPTVFVSALDARDPATNRVTRQGGVFRGVIGQLNGRITEQWTPVSGTNNLPVGEVSDLIVDPASAGRMYAAVIGSGIFITTNNGAMWNPVNQAGGQRDHHRPAGHAHPLCATQQRGQQRPDRRADWNASHAHRSRDPHRGRGHERNNPGRVEHRRLPGRPDRVREREFATDHVNLPGGRRG